MHAAYPHRNAPQRRCRHRCRSLPGEPGGRPISVHLHGSQSLAPYDGWAEDEICGGESKDYIYPVNEAANHW